MPDIETPTAGTPLALSWRNLSALLGPMTAAPLWDINSQWVSSSSDETGTEVVYNNLVAGFGLAGIWDAIRFDFGLAVPFIPGWVPASNSLRIRGTIVTRPPAASRSYFGIGFADSAVRLANFRSVNYLRENTSVEFFGGAAITGIPAPELRAGVEVGLGVATPAAPSIGTVGAMDATATNSLGAWTILADPRLQVYVNTMTGTNTGPHTIKILWEYALSEFD